eukprot:gene20020-26736_t
MSADAAQRQAIDICIFKMSNYLLKRRLLSEQASTKTYSLEANLALLRFYQFQPSSTKIPILAKVLLKSVMQLPQPDFKICAHLIPERLQNEELVSKIMGLASSLETSRFTEFWGQAVALKETISHVPGFYDAVRAYVLHTLSISFQRVPKSVLGEYLQLEGASLDNLIKDKCANAGWSVQSSPAGELVALPKGEQNQLVVKRTQEVIKFEQVSPVLRTVTVGF